MAKVLVAGGAGFIGSHLCKRLLDGGYSVVCLDSLITGNKDNIAELIDNPRFSFVTRDITQSLSDLAGTLSDSNYIFHLASPASPIKKVNAVTWHFLLRQCWQIPWEHTILFP